MLLKYWNFFFQHSITYRIHRCVCLCLICLFVYWCKGAFRDIILLRYKECLVHFSLVEIFQMLVFCLSVKNISNTVKQAFAASIYLILNMINIFVFVKKKKPSKLDTLLSQIKLIFLHPSPTVIFYLSTVQC